MENPDQKDTPSCPSCEVLVTSTERPYIQSGPHLGAARSWLQRHASNGEYVTWGSQDIVKHQFTAADIDDLAQRVADAVFREKQEFKERIDNLRNKLLKAECLAYSYKERIEKSEASNG